MDCESIVNMPVKWGSRVLGTVNLMHGEGHYGETDLPCIEAWAQLLVPAFLAISSDTQDLVRRLLDERKRHGASFWRNGDITHDALRPLFWRFWNWRERRLRRKREQIESLRDSALW